MTPVHRSRQAVLKISDHGELSVWDGDQHIVDLQISDRSNRKLADLIAERDRLQAKAA